MNELMHRMPLPAARGSSALVDLADYARRQRMQVDTGLTLAVFLKTVRRRKWTLVLTALVVTGLAFLASVKMTPKYTATTSIIVEPTQVNMGDVQSVLKQLVPERDPVASQVEVLYSRSLANRVIDQLELASLPEFNPALRAKSMTTQAVDWLGGKMQAAATAIGGWSQQLFGEDYLTATEAPAEPDALHPDQRRAQIVQNFLDNLLVRSRGLSRVIEVSFTATDPVLAARIANTIADGYTGMQAESRIEAVRRVSRVIDERLGEMRKEVEASETKVEEYRARAGIVQGVNSGLVTEQISRLNSELIVAQAALAAAQGRLDQVKSNRALETAPEVLGSRVIQDQRQQESVAEAREAELSSRLGPRHPDVVQARSQLEQIRRSISAEVQRVIRGLENEVRASQSRVSGLQANLDRLRTTAARVSGAEIPLRAMEREAEASRTLLETLLSRSRGATEQFELAGTDSRVLSPAAVPPTPSFPNKQLIVAIAFIFSIVFGLLLIYLQEMMDQTFRSGEEVEAELGMPCLALVPMVKKPKLTGTIYDYVVSKPLSAFSESMRSLRASLWLCNPRPRCVLISSSRPGEAKTTTAVSLSRIAALSGERVMLIDCDMRQPSVKTALKAAESKGLSDLLAGEATLAEVTQTDHASDLQFITAGSRSFNSAKLLRSGAMDGLIDDLREEYDLVVLDAPPTLALADTRILGALVDAVIYCVHWRDTTRSVVTNGIRALTDAGANIVGVALTQVNTRAHARAGYADSELYHRRYSGYFTR